MSYYYTNEPVPEGYTVVKGKMLSTAARGVIEFRLAYDPPVPGKGSRATPVGLLIRSADLVAFKAVLDKRNARREHEKKHANPDTR